MWNSVLRSALMSQMPHCRSPSGQPLTIQWDEAQAQLPWWNMYPPDGEPEQYRMVAAPYGNDTTKQQLVFAREPHAHWRSLPLT